MRRFALLVALILTLPAGSPGPARAEALRTWTAEPGWVANNGVYRDNELVWLDYVYDDHGANTDGINRRDLPFGVWPNPNNPRDPRWSPTGGSTRYAGDFMYPATDNHMANVADLVEFRVAASGGDVFFRALLGDMSAPDSSVVAICIDTDLDHNTGINGAWPHGAGLVARLGCDHIVTLWGPGGGTITTPAEQTPLDDVVVDPAAATIEARVPIAPSGTWRLTVASGVWSPAAGTWLQVPPVPQVLGSSSYTGGGVGVPQIWDLLSNNGEPNSYWMEERQSNDLARHLLADHHIDVSFDRLADPADDPDPQLTGFVPRIYRSDHPTTRGRGVDIVRGLGTQFLYLGPYQPYAMIVPRSYYEAGEPALPFDTCLHPLNGNHMVEVYYTEAFAREGYNPLLTGTFPTTGYLGFEQLPRTYDRLNMLYACVLGRGEGLGYTGGDGLVDILEVQADVARHYNVDPDRHYLHGISLGAIGSWYVAPLYPDRYAAIAPSIFSPNIVNSEFEMLGNLYNVPAFFAIGTADEFAQGTQGDPTADALEAHGNEYVYLHYLGRQHEGRILLDSQPFIEALTLTKERVEDPARVRYTYDASRFSPKIPGEGSAYWVSGMTARSAGRAFADAVSLARAGELPTAQVVFDGLYTNPVQNWQARFRGLMRMTEQQFRAFWQPAQWEPGWDEITLDLTETTLEQPAVSNGFTLTWRNLTTVTLDAARMALDTGAPIVAQVTGDGAETTLTIAGTFAPDTPVTLDGAPLTPTITAGALTVTLPVTDTGTHSLEIG